MQTYAVPYTERAHRYPFVAVPTSYVPDSIFRQLGFACCLTLRLVAPPLDLSVEGVVLPRSDKEVIGPNTEGVIAVVTDGKTRGHGTEGQLPSEAMCLDRSLGGCGECAERAIARTVNSPHPDPTRVGLVNVSPESRFCRSDGSLAGVTSATPPVSVLVQGPVTPPIRTGDEDTATASAGDRAAVSTHSGPSLRDCVRLRLPPVVTVHYNTSDFTAGG